MKYNTLYFNTLHVKHKHCSINERMQHKLCNSKRCTARSKEEKLHIRNILANFVDRISQLPHA